jgi:putative sigma-54 modulation protein
MYVEIRARDFTVTEGIRLHVERRLGFALDRLTTDVRAVVVWISDINGPRHGGNDKCCRMAVQFTRGELMVEERAVNLYVAIDRATHRIGKNLARERKRAYCSNRNDLRWRSEGGEFHEGKS